MKKDSEIHKSKYLNDDDDDKKRKRRKKPGDSDLSGMYVMYVRVYSCTLSLVRF